MFKNRLLTRLQADETSYGLWVTLESPNVTEIAVMIGLDWVCIDMEHGHLDLREVMEHVRTVRGTETNVIVRVPGNEQGLIKRVLDVGAHGIILPYVRTPEEVSAAMGIGRYPPVGYRSIGGERSVKWGLGLQSYLEAANEEILIIPLIETREAVERIDEILAIPGLDVIFFGPLDLSASYGYVGQWEGPGVAEKILEVKEKAAKSGVAAGIMGTRHG